MFYWKSFYKLRYSQKAVNLYLAHLHHFLHEMFDYGLMSAIQESLFRVCYTTIFGFLSSMLYLNTFSIWSPILAHVWCNYFGVLFLPQSTDKLEMSAYVGGLGKWYFFESLEIFKFYLKI